MPRPSIGTSVQTLAVAESLAPLSRHLQSTVRSLAERERSLAGAGAVGTVVAAALLAPGGAHLWDWLRLLLIVGAATLAGAALASAHDLSADDGPRLAVALAATVLALVFAATFGLLTAALCSLALSVTDAALFAGRLQQARELAIAALAVLIPWSVWTALDAWDDRLLLLVPLAALAINAVAHTRLATATAASSEVHHEQPDDRSLSSTGHRLGGWLSLAAGAVLLLLAGAASSADGGWLMAGGLLTSVAIGIGVASEHTRASSWRRLHVYLLPVAFGLLGLVWLASL